MKLYSDHWKVVMQIKEAKDINRFLIVKPVVIAWQADQRRSETEKPVWTHFAIGLYDLEEPQYCFSEVSSLATV